MRASLLSLALLAAILAAEAASAAAVSGWVTGIARLERLAFLSPPSDMYALSYVYPLETSGGSIAVVMAFYGRIPDRAVYRLYRFDPGSAPRLLGEVSVTGIPLQPIALGDGRLLIGGASPMKEVLELYVWDTASGETEHVGSIRLQGRLAGSAGFERDGRVYLLLTTKQRITRGDRRLFELYTLDTSRWRVVRETVLPIRVASLFTSEPGRWVDLVDWNGVVFRVKATDQVRGLAAAVIGFKKGVGVVVSVYALVPRPEENRVLVLHATLDSRGRVIAEHHYVFNGVTWGRLYLESLSQPASLEEEFSQTLLIALHWDAKNRYLAVGSVDGLVGVYSHEQGFLLSTGASAGTLGVLWSAGKKGMVLLDTLGNVFNAHATYSMLVRAARLGPGKALIAVQDRPSHANYGKIVVYVGDVKPNPSAENDLYGTQHVVRWTTLEKPLQELTATTTTTATWTTKTTKTTTVVATATTTTAPTETTTIITTTRTAAPPTAITTLPPATTTTKTTVATTVAATTTPRTTIATTIAQTTPPPTTASTTAAESAKAGKAPWLEVLKPGDWVLYHGYVEANGRRAEFSFKIRIVNVDREGVEVEYVEVNVPGVGQGVPVVGNARTGLQWRYEAGSEPACGVVGLNLFAAWADPRVLPANGVVEGEGYRCRYDTRSGLLLEYDATYSFFGTRQHVHYSLADTSVRGLAGGGGLLGGKGLLLVAAVGAAVAAVSLLVLARRS